MAPVRQGSTWIDASQVKARKTSRARAPSSRSCNRYGPPPLLQKRSARVAPEHRSEQRLDQPSTVDACTNDRPGPSPASATPPAARWTRRRLQRFPARVAHYYRIEVRDGFIARRRKRKHNVRRSRMGASSMRTPPRPARRPSPLLIEGGTRVHPYDNRRRPRQDATDEQRRPGASARQSRFDAQQLKTTSGAPSASNPSVDDRTSALREELGSRGARASSALGVIARAAGRRRRPPRTLVLMNAPRTV